MKRSRILRPFALRAAVLATVLTAVVAGCSPSDPPPLPSGPTESSTPSPTPGGRTNAVVTRVVDGDTVEVRFRGRTVDIRLIGIDTPETVDPTQPVGCYGKAASRFTTARLSAERVRLSFDLEREDRYERTLAYVWVGDRLFNEVLVRQGFASVSTYPPNVKYVDRFLAAQRIARERERGLWGQCPVAGDSGGGSCDPSYPDVCIPPPPPDLDCDDIAFRMFRVRGTDPYDFDADHNGYGCET